MIKVKSPEERLDDEMGNDEPTEDRLIDKQAGRFRKALIKVELDQDLEFQDVRLRILRFVEIDPESLKSEAVSGELLKSRDKAALEDQEEQRENEMQRAAQAKKENENGPNDDEFYENHSANQSNQDYEKQNELLRTIKDIKQLITE